MIAPSPTPSHSRHLDTVRADILVSRRPSHGSLGHACAGAAACATHPQWVPCGKLWHVWAIGPAARSPRAVIAVACCGMPGRPLSASVSADRECCGKLRHAWTKAFPCRVSRPVIPVAHCGMPDRSLPSPVGRGRAQPVAHCGMPGRLVCLDRSNSCRQMSHAVWACRLTFHHCRVRLIALTASITRIASGPVSGPVSVARVSGIRLGEDRLRLPSWLPSPLRRRATGGEGLHRAGKESTT